MKFGRKKNTKPTGRQRSRLANRQPPQAFSYYAQRSERSVNTGRELGRDETAAKPALAQVLLRRAGLLILALVILLVVITNLTLSTSPRVMPLGTGTNTYFLHSIGTYQQSAEIILKKSLWNRNKLTIDTTAFSTEMKQQFPELSEVSVTLPLLGHRPVLYIAPGQPSLILNTSDGGFVLDNSGTAVLPATQLPATTKLDVPIVLDQTGLKVRVGQQALTSGDISFIQQIVAQLKAHSLQIASLTLPATASELDARLQAQPYYIKFNMHATSDDARQQAGTFIAVQHKLASQSITPSEYIDVRVDGRAYYK